MDIGPILGIAIAVGGILLGYILDEGALAALIQKPAAAIVFGGTIGAVVLSFPWSEIMKLPKALKHVFLNKKIDEAAVINEIAELSVKARKDGLLSLEQDVRNSSGDFMKKGLMLVIDGIEAEMIKDILHREIDLRESIHESAAKIFEAAGGYAPTMGVLGTVMGMVSILGSMESEPGGLGGKIATAFIATMYGVSSANVLWLPLAGRIKAKAERERQLNEIIVEGLLSIQAGENPRIIKEKLNLSLHEKAQKKSARATGRESITEAKA